MRGSAHCVHVNKMSYEFSSILRITGLQELEYYASFSVDRCERMSIYSSKELDAKKAATIARRSFLVHIT